MLLDRLSTRYGSFAELASSMAGAWPPETLAALKALTESGRVSQVRFDALISTQSGLPLKVGSDPTRGDGLYLPEPHPLNYDWRFSAHTIDALVGRISADARPMALLGVPSLYRPLLKAGHEVTLFDVNAGLCFSMTPREVTNFVCVDLQDELAFKGKYDVAVADPPWYLEYYASFFKRLQQLLSPGGKALVSVLPVMTRPSAAADQEAIVTIAKTLGFDLNEIVLDSLVYDTPSFEAAALSCEGLSLPQWRRADLYVFTRTHDIEENDLVLPGSAVTNEVRWETFRFGACSIAVRKISASSSYFTFAPSSESGRAILQSVSRRSEARRHANIWSSRNHVVQASRTDCVIALFSRYSRVRDRREALSYVQSAYGLDSASMSELGRLLNVLEECFS